MALIKCPACGSDVSSDAPACPKCGHPIASANKSSKKLSGGWWLVIIVAIISIFGFLIPEYGKSGSSDNSRGNHSGSASFSYGESVLYRFRGGTDGDEPSSLIMDGAGNLYGTTYSGGRSSCPNGCGVVFKLAPDGSGGYTESVLYRFRGGSDGDNPSSRLIMDGAGNLYGTARGGGIRNCYHRSTCGVVFKLAPDGSGSYTESILYRFRGGSDVATPFGRLIMDGAGNLYGTTSGGKGSKCHDSCGVVFKLAPDASGGYTESVLYRFRGGSHGDYPSGSLIMDEAGNLYGTTDNGGRSSCPNGCGVVFKLAPDGNDGGYTESILYRFRGGTDGDEPSSLIMDSSGNLYGTTNSGGRRSCGNGCGVVFKLAPDGNGGYTESILYRFRGGTDGDGPFGSLIMDGAGNLYGATFFGGTNGSRRERYYVGDGVVFKLAPDGSGGYTESVLYRFRGGSDGDNPIGGLIMDSSGNLYGTAGRGGIHSCDHRGCGIVYEIRRH